MIKFLMLLVAMFSFGCGISVAEEPDNNEMQPEVQTTFEQNDEKDEIAADMEEQFAVATPEDIEAKGKEGFDFNTKDVSGNAPLYYALTRNPDLKVAEKMIEYGADVNMPAANGMIPLNVATSKANELQLQIMMMQTMGLDLNDEKVAEQLKQNLFREMSRMLEMVQLLIKHGADVNQESALGTPLMNAVTNAWNLDIAEELIKSGADLNKTDKHHRTALFYAESSGNEDMATMLIKKGADTSVKDEDDRTYLEIEKISVPQPF